jgi:peptidoglycan/xylan/chitin deacetylase (PgdA/CDA1 family)
MARMAGVVIAPALIWCLRLTKRKAGIALLYHAVDSRQGNPKKELSAPIEQGAFMRQLAHLRRHHQIVPPEKLLETVAARRRGQRFPVCLTFDDDLSQHIDYTMPILRRQEIPATFFLTGASLGGPASGWWERIDRAVAAGRKPRSLARFLPADPGDPDRAAVDIRALRRSVESLKPAQRRAFSQQLLIEFGPDPPDSGLSRSAVSQLAEAGFGIGFHTRHHDTLTALNDEELMRSMNEGRAELSEVAGAPLCAIAYPHGHGNARVANAARTAGFEMGFTATRRAVTPESDPLLLGRCDTVSVLGPSLGEFAIGAALVLLSRKGERDH